jgi:hypothetical protein
MGAVLALSCGGANAATPGYACVSPLTTIPTPSSEYQAFEGTGTLYMEGIWITKINGKVDVAGMYRCSATSGVDGEIGNPHRSPGQYCWCKLIAISEHGAVSGPWVFRLREGNYPNICLAGCASRCGDSNAYPTEFNKSFFSGVIVQ